jgi:hypothetical protein
MANEQKLIVTFKSDKQFNDVLDVIRQSMDCFDSGATRNALREFEGTLLDVWNARIEKLCDEQKESLLELKARLAAQSPEQRKATTALLAEFLTLPKGVSNAEQE